MKTTRIITIELDDEDVNYLNCLLDFCSIEDALRSGKDNVKGYLPWELKKAYTIMERLREL